ncbi:hypothetical protein LTR66_016408, partial [Elasticomyces elasticus]
GYAFLIGLLTYGQLIVASFVGAGRFKLKKTILRTAHDLQGWKAWIPSNTINFGLGWILAVANFFLLVAAAWTVSEDQNDPLAWTEDRLGVEYKRVETAG